MCCQTLVCGCWWCSCCNIACMGVAMPVCCFECWCGKHDQLVSFNEKCCTCCEKTGFGGVCCCCGSICCAPEWLTAFSNKRKSM